MNVLLKILFGLALVTLTTGCSADPRSKFINQIEADLEAAQQRISKEYEIDSARVAVFDAAFTGIDESPYEGDATFEIVGTRDLYKEDYSGPCRVKMVYTANYLYGKEGWQMTDYHFTSESHDAYDADDEIKAAIHQSLDGKISKSFEAVDWPSYESAPELQHNTKERFKKYNAGKKTQTD